LQKIENVEIENRNVHVKKHNCQFLNFISTTKRSKILGLFDFCKLKTHIQLGVVHKGRPYKIGKN